MIQDDAEFLAEETHIYSIAQNATLSENIDNYIQDLDNIINLKMYRYKKLSKMLKKFKEGLEEEEQIFKKITELNKGPGQGKNSEKRKV